MTKKIKKEELKHGSYLEIPTKDISVNNWNPQEMTDAEFSMLGENIGQVGFLDPILVVPAAIEDGVQKYTIIDGEHRFESIKDSVDTVPAIICDPKIFDEKTSKLQTVRLNKIKGAFNIHRFDSLVKDLMKNHDIAFDEMANELGFADESEFQELVDEARRGLPKEARKEFDRKVKSIDDIDALHRMVEKLWMKFGDTLPASWMVLDFGSKRHIWVQLQKPSHVKTFVEKFRECLAEGHTVDSMLYCLLNSIDIAQFIRENKDVITKIPANAADSVDVLLMDDEELNDDNS